MFVVNEFRAQVFKNLSVYKRNSLDLDQVRNSIYVCINMCVYIHTYIYMNLPLVSTKR